MSDSDNEYAKWKKESEAQKQGTIEWLKKINLSYDDLISLTAAMMVESKQTAKEFELMKAKISSENTIHELVSLIGHPKFSEAGILRFIDSYANDPDEENKAVTSIRKAIAITNAIHKKKSKDTAAKGGQGKAKKFKLLETETIKLFTSGKWKSAPIAAQDITPKIVALSKDGNGDLLPSTTKPLEWIRAHIKSAKSNLS